MSPRDQLVVWLTDAHAMEAGMVSTLEKHANDALEEPEALAVIIKHLEETRRHVELVSECLHELQAGPSVLKAGLAKFTNFFSDMPTSLAPDSVIKNAATQYGGEHFEIASYSVIIDAAVALGLPDIARVCRQILAEEKAQARALEAELRRTALLHLRVLAETDPLTYGRDPALPRLQNMPAKSKKQQMAAGAALSAKKGDTKKSSLKGASKQMEKSMSKKQLEELAATKRKKLPTKKK